MTDFDVENTPIRLNPTYRFQWEEAQDRHVLLFPEGMIKLSGSAAEILKRCIEQTTFTQLVDELTKAFPDADGLAADAKRLRQAGGIRKAGLIVGQHGPEPPERLGRHAGAEPGDVAFEIGADEGFAPLGADAIVGGAEAVRKTAAQPMPVRLGGAPDAP